MKKILSLILCVVLLTTLFVGCSQKESKSSNEQGSKSTTDENKAGETTFGLAPFTDRTTLRVGFFSGSPHSIPFYIAEQEGFWDELNIDIEYQSFINGPAMMEAYANWDIADTGGPGVLVGQLGHGLKMVGICDYEENLALFVRPDHPIALSGKGTSTEYPEMYGTADDWKGTKWLYPAGTNLHMTLAKTLNDQGLTIDDVESVNMDVSSAFTAFKTGEGDGLAVWNAIAFAAEDEGFVRVADAGTQEVISACGLVATPDALADNRELIKKAWAVYYKTWEWCNESEENMQKAVDYYQESCEIEGVVSDADICKRSLGKFKCPTLDESVEIMTKSEPDRLGLYTARNLIKGENDLLYTMDFFISQGKYTDEDRNRMLEENMVDNSIAEEVATLFA